MESGPASPPSQFPFSPRAGSQARKRPPSLRHLRAAPRRGVLRRGRGKTPSGGNSPAAPRSAREPAAAGRLQRGPPRRGRRSARARVAGVSAASPRPSRDASPAAYLRGSQAPEPIHMVFSPPSTGATEATPLAPPRAREPVGLPRAPRGRRRVSPARRPDPSVARSAAAGRCGAGGGFVCARRALGALAEAPRARTEEDARLGGQPATAFAAGRRAGLGGLRSRRPLLLSRGSPLPAGSAPDRWRNCNNAPPPPRLLAATHADAPAPPAPALSEDGAGRTLREAVPAALSTHPSGAAGGYHWCLARGRG